MTDLELTDPPSLAPWLTDAGIHVETVKPRDCETKLKELVEVINGRSEVEEDVEPIVVVVDPLDRFRDLRQDDSFSFSLRFGGESFGGVTSSVPTARRTERSCVHVTCMQ